MVQYIDLFHLSSNPLYVDRIGFACSPAVVVDCVTVLVLDDELVARGDTKLLLAGVLVTPPAPDDVSDEISMVVVEKDIVCNDRA